MGIDRNGAPAAVPPRTRKTWPADYLRANSALRDLGKVMVMTDPRLSGKSLHRS
jgi:hypothetical protein